MTEHLDRIGADVEDGIRQLHRIGGQPTSNNTVVNLPKYVEHRPEVDKVGKLTSEAMAMTYEAAAKDIEAMGARLVEEVKSCEHHVMDAIKGLDDYKEMTRKAVEECQRTAELYRKEAKALFELLQTRSIAADNVRQLCQEMAGRIKT